MYLVYIDESKDSKIDVCAYSALAIRMDEWHNAFHKLIKFRKKLKDNYQIPLYYEMHSSDFLAGRGSVLFNKINTQTRIQIYKDFLDVATSFETAKIWNSRSGLKNGKQFKAFENLATILDEVMRSEDRYAILLCDEGDNERLTKMIRNLQSSHQMEIVCDMEQEALHVTKVQNPINRIIEDPVFKKSHDSYFIQLVDFVVHAFLWTKYPTDNKQYMKDIFQHLYPILEKSKEATKNATERKERGLLNRYDAAGTRIKDMSSAF